MDQVIRDGMDRLFDMGFTNYDANLSLLRKYKDFGMAAEHLCVHGDTGIVLNASNANKWSFLWKETLSYSAFAD